RNVIRPRDKSYGDTVTVTRSPTSTRILNFRILPAVVARTLCPLSSATRNMALGSTSDTMPSRSIPSSFMATSRMGESARLLGSWTPPGSRRGLVPRALRRFRLQLARFARFHVVPLATRGGDDARLLLLLLEALERPVDAVGIFEMNFGHGSTGSGDGHIAKADEPL